MFFRCGFFFPPPFLECLTLLSLSVCVLPCALFLCAWLLHKFFTLYHSGSPARVRPSVRCSSLHTKHPTMSLGSIRGVEQQQQQQQQQPPLEDASTASSSPPARQKRQSLDSRRRHAAAATPTKSTQHRNWTPDEDRQLLELVAKYDVLKTKRWTHIAELMGTGRIGKQCRDRYLNHIDPCVVKTPWTPEEDRAIIEAQRRLGNVWTKIAEVVGNGRAANGIKNRWNSCLKRRVMLSGKSSGSDCAESSPSLPPLPQSPPPSKRAKKSRQSPARPQPVTDKTPVAEPSSLVTFPAQVPEEAQPFRIPVVPAVLSPPPPITINGGIAATTTAPENSSPLSVGTSSVSSPSFFEQEQQAYSGTGSDMLPFLDMPDSNNDLGYFVEPGQLSWFPVPELDTQF